MDGWMRKRHAHERYDDVGDMGDGDESFLRVIDCACATYTDRVTTMVGVLALSPKESSSFAAAAAAAAANQPTNQPTNDISCLLAPPLLLQPPKTKQSKAKQSKTSASTHTTTTTTNNATTLTDTERERATERFFAYLYIRYYYTRHVRTYVRTV